MRICSRGDRQDRSTFQRLLGVSGLAAAAFSGATSAQQVDAALDGGVTEVIVTATRANVAGFSAPTPTTVVNAEDLERTQATNVADVLMTIPAFKPSASPAANGVKTQLPGANQADLRSLGPNRTLVLVDGMRVVPQAPSSNTGTPVAPDLNQIPSLMVDRVDVVTGGASAQWGSDAVGGVVNILLRKEFDGVQVTAQGGMSEHGDADNYRIGAIAGHSFFDDRLHVVGAFDHTRSDPVGDIYSRDWGRKEYQIVTNSAAATNGLPVNLVVPDVHIYSSPGLLITGPASFPFRNHEFQSNGSVTPFQTGSIVSGTSMVGGQGASQAKGLSLAPGIERFDPYVRVQYDVSDTLNLYAVGSYSMLRTELNPLPARITSGTIRADNAFLNQLYPQIAATMAPNSSFTFNRISYDLNTNGVNGPAIVHNDTPHVALGAEGSFGSTWRWDSHVGWGSNRYTNETSGNAIRQRLDYATDAVPSNGQIVCRALVPGSSTYNPTAAAGCVPINLFGDGSPSSEAKAYVMGTARSEARYDQTTAAFNLHGQPFSSWAGPIAVATGIEYRHEKERVTADAIGAAGGFLIANAAPFEGSFNVKEMYLETVVPLLEDGAFGKSLDLNTAVRVADYSTVDTQTTWKAGLTYEPISGLRFRGTRSRDIRAPALFELNSPGSITNNSVSVRNPANGTTYTSNIPVNITAGNANLDPERSDTSTLGVVLEPVFLPGFSASIDYYDIDVQQAITSLSSTAAASLCNAGDAFYCSAFTFSPAGPPTALLLGVQNLASVRVKGIDLALSYRFPLSFAPGNIQTSLTGTYTTDVLVDTGTGSTPIDRSGENSAINTYATPRARINASVGYAVGGFSTLAQLSYISSGSIDNTFNTSPTTTSNLNHVPAITYLNLFTDYEFGERLQLFASVRNAFDKDPPPVPSVSLNVATNGQYYDTIGRSYQLGVRMKF